jgi:hypothetical protein
LGLDWAFDNQSIINLKTRKMIFESREYIFIAPLDSSKGGMYVEPTMDNILTEDVNQLYMTTPREEDYINPTTDVMLSWRIIGFCALKSDTGLEKWQKRLHELSTMICAKMRCALIWVGTKVREPPTF